MKDELGQVSSSLSLRSWPSCPLCLPIPLRPDESEEGLLGSWGDRGLSIPASPLPPSLRYHNLHPDYIHERLQSLGKSFALRVLLVQVDVVSRGHFPASFSVPICEMGSISLALAKGTVESLPRRNAN